MVFGCLYTEFLYKKENMTVPVLGLPLHLAHDKCSIIACGIESEQTEQTQSLLEACSRACESPPGSAHTSLMCRACFLPENACSRDPTLKQPFSVLMVKVIHEYFKLPNKTFQIITNRRLTSCCTGIKVKGLQRKKLSCHLVDDMITGRGGSRTYP